MNGKELFLKEKSCLLEILRKDGIYYGLPDRPVLTLDGKPARWMLDSLSVTLTSEGINLAGRCLLKLLESFDGRTLATYGTIGIPLMTSCILQSGGRYEGLIVRKEIKTYGSRKSIEGRVNKNEPVIIVDDSVSSGRTMLECRRRLEAEGFFVEGGICLVRFGWHAGFATMRKLGYHMESLYDIWDDFMAEMENEPHILENPTKNYPEFDSHQEKAREGCHPAILARMVIDEFLRTGKLMEPPKRLDKDYDGAGGVWVSVRPKSNIYLRHARNGMWHFPGESFGPTPKDVVMASLKTACELEKGDKGRKLLEESAVAVTFFSEMEECCVGELDNDRYGIVVVSKERKGVMGGALPRMPGIRNSWMQFQHARIKNAKLFPFEPYKIFRHDVEKIVEPNITWQPTGVPKGDKTNNPEWYEDPLKAGKIAQRALDLVNSNLKGSSPETQPLPGDFIPPNGIQSLFVTYYVNGKLKGCMGASLESPEKLEDLLTSLCKSVLEDDRFVHPDEEKEISSQETPECSAVSVSFLREPLNIGVLPPQEIMVRVLYGEQALMVLQGNRSGILLPFVCTLYNLSPEAYALEVIDKAGITRAPYFWRRYECQSWLVSPNSNPSPMRGMFPISKAPENPEKDLSRYAQLLSDYLVRSQKEDGSLYFRYMVFSDVLTDKIDLPRMSHGCWTITQAAHILEQSHIREASEKMISYLVGLLLSTAIDNTEQSEIRMKYEELSPSVSELSFLLLAICDSHLREEYREIAEKIAQTLWSRIDNHGKIAVSFVPSDTDDPLQDYFPGQMLMALAAACNAGFCEKDKNKIDRAFRFYRHRFRYKRDFGQVSWMMQAFTSWWFIFRDPEYASFVFEIGEWVLEFQNRKEGGFWNDHQPDTPGFTTSLYMEGLGEALRIAQTSGDTERAERYRHACLKGLSFLDRLIIQERDFPILPNSEWALGGVRGGIYQSEVRTDFVQHTLSAVLKLLR